MNGHMKNGNVWKKENIKKGKMKMLKGKYDDVSGFKLNLVWNGWFGLIFIYVQKHQKP